MNQNQRAIKVICSVQFVVVVAWAALLSLGHPEKSTVLHLVLLSAAAFFGLGAASSRAARKAAIILNWFEVIMWGRSIWPVVIGMHASSMPNTGMKVTIALTFAILLPCAANALLLMGMREPDLLEY